MSPCRSFIFPFHSSPSRDRDNRLRDDLDGGDDLSHVYLSYGAGVEAASGRPRTARGKAAAAAANGRPKSGKPKSKR